MKKYTQLTQEERYHIYALKKSGESQSDIAKELGRHRSTIGRELKKNSGMKNYRPKQAHRFAQTRKANRAQSRISKDVWDKVEKMILEEISPEQISCRLKLEHDIDISHETIYQYIREDKKAGGKLHTHLRHAGKRRKKRGSQSKRGQIPNRKSIDERPEHIEKRDRIGDWEIDTIIGKNHQGAFVTIVERKSRYTRIQYIVNRTASATEHATVALLESYGKKVKTITADNGKEFTNHENIASRLDAVVYFAHPYSPWERGTNENTNGLLRQYFPKGSSFDGVTPERIQEVEDRLNHRPRKCLGFLTPHEVFFEQKCVALTI